MNDENKRSVASAGSVAGEPVAWAVVGSGETEGHVAGLHDTRMEAEMRISRMESVGDCARAAEMSVVPLYRSPTLTAAEREAIEAAIDRFRDWVNGTDDDEREATLCGLLERTK